ncbi:hypothetical protein K523DRAFT_73228 [Schizophyllum commune Tattone D]|nr:hypothetical protein K523DRAFT_73228 [Schizophyllum commune Tattone D]
MRLYPPSRSRLVTRPCAPAVSSYPASRPELLNSSSPSSPSLPVSSQELPLWRPRRHDTLGALTGIFVCLGAEVILRRCRPMAPWPSTSGSLRRLGISASSSESCEGAHHLARTVLCGRRLPQGPH